MASPFAVFRRNQKILLAIVGIGAMVAFVFLDPLMKYVGRTRRQENPVVVQTKFGALTESEIAGIRQSRDLVDLFLKAVSVETVNAQIKKGAIDARMQDQALNQWYGYWREQLMVRSAPGPEEAAVETLVLSKKAQQLGMVVSDRAINDLLKQVTSDSLTSDALQTIVNSLQTGRRISVARLFDAIRTEMLASKLIQMFRVSLGDVTPAQRFEYFSRLNRRAKAEVMPLAVADFVSQVADPSPEQLSKFFDEHKDRYPDPSSPEPGFKEPKRAAFQYFKADFAKFKEEFKPQVTEEEIAEYYEKNKTQFRAVDLPADTNEKPKSEAAPAESPEAKPDEQPKPEGDKPADAKPAEPAPDAKGVDPAADKPTENKPADEKPAAEPKAANEKPADSQPPQTATDKTPIQVAQIGNGSTRASIRLVSAATADDDRPAEPAAPASDAPAAATAGEAKPETKPAETPAPETPADETAKPADEQPAAEGADKPASPPDQMRYEPLEKVKDSIRDSIAGQKATKRIGEIFEQLSAEMRRYSDDLDVYNAAKSSNSAAKPPKPFPFKELAEAKQVIAKETDLITASEAASGTDIGQVQRPVQDRRSQFGFRLEPFSEFAFSDSLLIYQPRPVDDNEGNMYLFWKTKERAAYIPTLDQVRDQVIHAWKMIQARELARTRADEYARQDRAAKIPLKEFFGKQENLKVIETSSFSWLSSGNVPFDPANSQPRISQVDGVERVGPEFMETVFGLSPGDVAVTRNHPRDTVYVVRLIDYEQPTDELRNEFASEKQMRYMSVAAPDQRQMYLAWLDHMNKDAGVHWLRQADVAASRRAAANPSPADFDDE
ncbi:MAG: hypothetical protein HY288_06070 [Planctomycetia bacterium]|nr:hypothetical protein [Planctomycetia bacterium]